jgi:hypothetical protein
MKRLIIISIALIVLVFIYASALAGVKGSMTGLGVGARANVFHGSYAGIADDYAANFWNPAGAGFINQFNFGAMQFNMPLNRNISYLALVYPITDYDRIGINWTGFAIDGLQGRQDNSEFPDYYFSNSDQTIWLTYSRRVVDQFSIGINGKFLYQSLDKTIGMGYSLDVGLMYTLLQRAKIGLVFYDINSELKWQTGSVDQFERMVNLAGSYQFDNLLLALGIESNYSTKQPELRLSGGAEFNAKNLIYIRAGLYDSRPSVGLGVKFLYRNIIDIAVNYTAITSKLSNDLGHCCEVSFAWNKPASRRDITSNIATATEKPKSKPTQLILPNEIQVVYITGNKVNVRKGPGLVYMVIGVVLQNQVYPLIGEYQGWYQINFSGIVGWIDDNYAVVR